jgi:hypothetical protein
VTRAAARGGVLLAACWGAAAGCATRPAAPAGAAQPAPPPADGEATVLIDAGREPRRRLRLQPRPGTRQTMVMDLEATSGSAGEGRGEPPLLLRWQAEVAVRSVDPDGAVRYAVSIRSAPAGDAGMAFFAGEGVASELGRSRAYEVDPVGAGAERAERLSSVVRPLLALPSYIVPFPAEPVGPGARWRVRVTETEEGVTATLVFDYELVALDGSRGEVTVRWANAPLSLPLQIPGERGEPASVSGLATSGRGRVAFDPDAVLPAAELSWSAQATMAREGEKPVVLNLQQRLALRPVGAERLVATATSPYDPEPDDRLVFANPCWTFEGAVSGAFAARRAIGWARTEGRCQGGLPEGRWRSYDDKGHLELEGDLRAGAPEGTWTQRRPDGQPLGGFTLPGGSGRAILRFADGSPRVEAELRGGKLHGPFRSWHAGGRPFREGAYEDGQRSGRWVTRSSDGARTTEELFDPACAIVTGAVASGPAAKAGIRAGDRIVRVDGTAITPQVKPSAAIEQAGDRAVAVEIDRAGTPLTFTMTARVDRGRRLIGVRLACRHAPEAEPAPPRP